MLKKMNPRFALGAAFLLLSPALLAGCGSDDTEGASDATTTTAAAPANDDLVIAGTWSRSTADGATVGAVYAEITGGTEDDALLSVRVDASVAGEAQIHEVTMSDGSMGDDAMGDDAMGDDAMGDDAMGDDAMGDDAMGDDTMSDEDMEDGHSGDMDGTMQMSQIESLPIPAGETVSLAPGGYHIMLLDLAAPLVSGDTFDATLNFENAGDVVVTVEVRDE